MIILVKIAALAAAVALPSQACLAAAVESRSAPVAASMAASATERIDFNRERVRGEAAFSTSASMSLAASQQTGSEAEDPPKRRGPGTTTWIVIGGVVLLVVVLAAVASALPQPGPREGAFD